MADEYKIDFNKFSIADSDFEGDKNDFIYTAMLEFNGNQEETDKFKYEIMKRAAIDDDLNDIGIEVDSFEKFQELQRDEKIQLDIVVSYIFDGGAANGLVANALYEASSTHYTDMPLNENEKEGYENFSKEVLSKDISKIVSVDMEMD